MTTEPVYVLGRAKQLGPFAALGKHLRSAEGVRRALSGDRRARWILGQSTGIKSLFTRLERRETFHRALVLERVTRARREFLSSFFRTVVAPGDGVNLLRTEELIEVLRAEHPEDYFIGGLVDEEDGSLVLYRGNFDRLLVPLTWFQRSGKGDKPDPKEFSIIDTGQTVRLGKYQAATDAILYEFDDEARGRMKRRELADDTSFGAALRRLRLQKGLSQADFGDVSAKTVARIERGEVERPQRDTLAAIAKRLGVESATIETY